MPPSKRSLHSLPSTPSKKQKNNHSQGKLDSFFLRSPSVVTGTPTVIKPVTRHGIAEIGSVVTLETARKAWISEPKAPAASVSTKIPEIIVVDSSDDDDSPMIPGPTAQTSFKGCDASPSKSPRQSIGIPVANPSVATSAEYPSLHSDPITLDVQKCPWNLKSAAPYSFLANTLSTLVGTRSRIAIINILTNTLRFISRHHPPSLLPALYLLSNSLSPPYLAIELGLGSSIISKAIQHISGLTPAALKNLYKNTGDPGDVAFEAKSNLRTLLPHPPLSITTVYESLLKIARAKGNGAGKQKKAIVEKMLVASKGEETRYLVRTLCQNIRVGAVRTSILTALARSMVLTRSPNSYQPSTQDSPYYAPPELLNQVKASPTDCKKKAVVDPAREAISAKFENAEGLLKRIYVQHPNYDDIVAALVDVGLEGLADRVPLSVGIPLHPTLGSPTRSLDQVYERLGDLAFTAEFKYDGQRAQVHAAKSADGDIIVKIFSRHLEDMTDKYPDVISLVEYMFSDNPETVSFIMDTEIVAIDPASGSLKSFQELSNRARKDVRLQEIKITVCVFAFDLMYHNGQALLQEPFRKRRARLRAAFPLFIPEASSAARFAHVDCCESEDGREAVEEFWQRSIESRSEGLMIKLLDSGEVTEAGNGAGGKTRCKPLPATYEPDKRTLAWLKLKKDYVNDLGDSLDLVPIGAWQGSGRKYQWWSPILLALWDESAGEFVGVCKCMSGFTDEFYKALKERYTEGTDTCSPASLWNCNTGGLIPQVYFKPQEVWEIRGADITVSPVSVAAFGLASPSRGLSLRFPRFIRVRQDKGPENASSPEFLAKMWQDQEGRGKNQSGVDDGELVDVEFGSSGGEEEFEDEAE